MAEIAEVWKKREGQTVDQVFPLNRYLAASENGAVFLTQFDEQRAALKLVKANSQTADVQLSRWQSAAKLSHPHMLRLFRWGRCDLDGTPWLYLVMEYAEEDLSQVVPNRPLTTIETLEMLRPTLEALDYVHGEGFVHGHLKPSNIMAVEDQLKLSSDRLRPIGEKRCPVKDIYDAPEEAVSPASDAWSLGVTLLQILTQRLPVWNDAAEPEVVIPGGLLEPFQGIVRQCLQRNPRQRPAMAEIAKRLSRPAPGLIHGQSLKWAYVAVAAIVASAGVVMLARKDNPPAPETKVVDSAPQALPPVTPPATPPEPKPAVKRTKASPKASVPAVTIPANTGAASAARPPSPKAPAPAVTGQDLPEDVLEQPLPEITQKVRNTIHGKVRINVRVKADPSGSVTEATLEPPAASKYLSDLTLKAARRWKFRPQDANREWILRFQFARTGTTVSARRL